MNTRIKVQLVGGPLDGQMIVTPSMPAMLIAMQQVDTNHHELYAPDDATTDRPTRLVHRGRCSEIEFWRHALLQDQLRTIL